VAAAGVLVGEAAAFLALLVDRAWARLAVEVLSPPIQQAAAGVTEA